MTATFFKKLKRVRQTYQEGGYPLILLRIKRILFGTNSHWWFIRNLSLPFPEFPHPMDIRLGKDQDDQVVDYMRNKNLITQNELAVAKEVGHRFLGLIAKGEVKGCCKCGFNRVYDNSYDQILELPFGIACIYLYEIDESLRNQGIGKFFVSSILRWQKARGYKFAICYIAPWNLPSQKVMEACGFQRMKKIRFVKFFGLKWKSRNINKLLEKAMRS